MTGTCNRQDELLEALGRAFVPEHLTAHLAQCDSCAELRLVAGALLEERSQAMTEAPVPSAAAMWLRMQLRREHEVEAGARRSLLIGQAVTLTVAMVLIAAVFSSEISAGIRHAFGSISLSTPLILVLATWALLAPLGGWVAIRAK